MFKENLIELNLPAVSAESGNGSEYSIDRLSSGLQQLLQHHSMEDVYYIKTPTQGRDYWWLATRSDEIFLYDVNGAPVADHWLMLPVLYWLGEFHTELLLHDGGTTLLTLLGIGCLILMLAGLISWWPGRSGFRLSHLWAMSARRGPALRQHRAVAIICLPLLLLSVLTGAGMSVQSAIGFFIETTSVAAPEPEPTATVATLEFELSQLDALLQSAQQRLPDSQITMLSLPTAAKPYLGMRLRAADEWHVNGKTNMMIDIASGAIKIKDVKDASAGRKILNTFYPLHSSYGLPGLYKALVVITGVLTVLLGVLGLLAWLRRRGGMLN
ncbi:PepSY-associated TM helix domain-containing protein [Oceanicoccus sp. KOV_DT_Chl]|uniref:PepSY-associated TM helix domain-containing protein n=1 Tax=Oceanicoccus sp. KOV_DT_Chl TaxID=1904639 RepID=UPI0011AF3BB6|nr:PepSY-associated TM helix domain-containing protein [Oceanicoccus sp. KOV_DT_Chl]